MGDPLYEKMVSDIRDGVIRAGKIFGCANATYRDPAVCHEGAVDVSKDALFFQNGKPSPHPLTLTLVWDQSSSGR